MSISFKNRKPIIFGTAPSPLEGYSEVITLNLQWMCLLFPALVMSSLCLLPGLTPKELTTHLLVVLLLTALSSVLP